MLTVEQVKKLDEKVHKALELIDTLKKENLTLKNELGSYEQKIENLEATIDGFRNDQSEIENGIKDVLEQLDILEEQIAAPVLSQESQKEEFAVSNEVEPNDNTFSEETFQKENEPEESITEDNEIFQTEEETKDEESRPTSPELEIF